MIPYIIQLESDREPCKLIRAFFVINMRSNYPESQLNIVQRVASLSIGWSFISHVNSVLRRVQSEASR